MGYKPIIGHDGATPVLNFAGTAPVVMETPCPYAQWDAEVTDNPYGTVSGGGGWWRIDSEDVGGYANGDAVIKIKMISTKPEEIVRATLTSSGGVLHAAYITMRVGAWDEDQANLVSGGTVTADLAVPYYRYWIELHLALYPREGPATWARVDFALV
jgi:hypothetical protein